MSEPTILDLATTLLEKQSIRTEEAEAEAEQLFAEVGRRLPIEDVERFLKRERDQHGKESYWWRAVDEVLDAFRLHMVTGTPLTDPRPTDGPEAPGVGKKPLTEAEELRAEVGRLTAEQDALRKRAEAAEAVMRRALTEVEHEEVVYLLNRYLTAVEAQS